MLKCNDERAHIKAVDAARKNALTATEIESMCNVFRVLAQPSRLKIVLTLMQGEMCVYHISKICGGTVSNISHQLRILKDYQIVKMRRLGQNVEYSIADKHVREIVEMAKEHLACRQIDEV